MTATHTNKNEKKKEGRGVNMARPYGKIRERLL